MSLQPAYAQNLTRVHVQIEMIGTGPQGKSPHLQRRSTVPAATVALAGDWFSPPCLPRRHEIEQHLARTGGAIERGHAKARTQNRGPVGNILDFIHAMGHEKDRPSFVAEFPKQLEKPVPILDIQRGRRFIQDQQTPGTHQRACDGDLLPSGKRKRPREPFDLQVFHAEEA